MNKELMEKEIDLFIKLHLLNEYSTKTVNQYKQSISSFILFFENNDEITKLDMLNYKQHLTKKYASTRSVNKNITVINKYLKWLCKEDKYDLDLKGIKCDLCLKKIKMQEKASNEEVLSTSEYKRLLKWSKKLGLNQLYLIMKILAMTGIRISELEFFTVENIKKNKHYIRVYNKGTEREIIIRQDLSREIRRYCRENKIKSGFIFKGEIEGKMPAQSTIWRQMKKVAGAARINKKKIHAHSFRHLFSQRYLTAPGGDVTNLMNILGHKSLETTKGYTQLSSDQKRSILEDIKY